jgi:peptidoglycan-associated lipoprotein
MRVQFGKWGKVLLVMLMITSVFACAKKPVPAQSGLGPGAGMGGELGSGGYGSGGSLGLDDARWRELGIHSEAEKREFLEQAQAFENQDIYFDFDSYTLSDPAKKIVDSKVEFLRRYSKVKVTVEGHCDERGTTEYNLALGERRANSAMQYMVNSGIRQDGVSTISYGKERPLATGGNEASWAKNRRAHFVLNY